ncbi:MAG: AAA family ATPase [Alphaproteobacteria bacterium]
MLEQFGIQPETEASFGQGANEVKTYDYFDAQGVSAYQVQRFYPKSFKQRRPDGNGGWIYNLKGIVSFPYLLPQILSRPDETIYIVEGEQCADALANQGLLATTNSGGAGNWRQTLNHYFRGRDVVILPDNDDAGRSHAHKVSKQLFGTAKTIKVLELPDLPPRGDIINWFASGNDSEKLKGLVSEEAVISEFPDFDSDENERPYTFLTAQDIYLLPDPKPLIEDLIFENSFCVMYGAPGSGKSFCALDMGLSIAVGMPWQNKMAQQGSVLYIAGEGVGGLSKRLKAFQHFHGLSQLSQFYVLQQAVNFRDETSVRHLLNEIDKNGADFNAIFIDTVARAMLGGDENSAADMGAFIGACDRVRNYTGAAVIGVHHSGKDINRGMRGSSALLGAVDTSIEVKNTDGLICLKTLKQKDQAEHPPIYLKMKAIALVDGSSVALELISSNGDNNPIKRPKFGSARQYAAYQALRNLLIDEKVSKVPVGLWHKAHADKSPDLDPSKRKDARQQLQDKGLVVISDSMVWINREIEANMEPYSDAND